MDVVIGTHPHTIQPVEWIEGSKGNKMLCVYSLGNFIGGMLTTDNAIGGEIKFDLSKKGKRYLLKMLNGSQRSFILKAIKPISWKSVQTIKHIK